MNINVGSKNNVKVDAVKNAVSLYPALFPAPEVFGKEIELELYGHPKNLDETIRGAVERAKKAFENCHYSFGLEGGLIEVPHTKSGFMEVSACAVYDGKNVYIGLGPAFEWPKEVTDAIVRGESDASKAFKELGLTEHDKLGAAEGGIIGFLTGGRLTREEQVKHSILMALIQLEKPELY